MAESLSFNNVTRQIAREDILNNQRRESFKSYCIKFSSVDFISKLLFRYHSKRCSYVELFGLQNKYCVSPCSVKLSSPRLPEWAFQLRSWRIRLTAQEKVCMVCLSKFSLQKLQVIHCWIKGATIVHFIFSFIHFMLSFIFFMVRKNSLVWSTTGI